MRQYLFIFFITLSITYPKVSLAQKDINDFQKNFNLAKQHLSKREILKALPYLEYLSNENPKNANLKYLIGVCYAEAEIVNPKSILLLENATQKASLEYNPNSIDEQRVPVYVFYYLCIAYAQNGSCEAAENARVKFLEIYPHKDEFYIKESLDWIKKCRGYKEKPKTIANPTDTSFRPFISSKTQKQSTKTKKPINQKDNVEKPTFPKEKKVIKTHKIEYSTSQPLYGVQLGAFKEVVPVSRFKEFKNVDAFMDKEGLIRYAIGHFSIYSQAESLLKLIISKGYVDAFVVNVNNEKMFSEEVISVNNVNIRAGITGKVEFRVQIGAFKISIPNKTAEAFLMIDGVKTLIIDDYTYLTAGNYKTYNEAKAYLHGIKSAGIEDAFVIAVNNGKKISLQQAKDFEKQ